MFHQDIRSQKQHGNKTDDIFFTVGLHFFNHCQPSVFEIDICFSVSHCESGFRFFPPQVCHGFIACQHSLNAVLWRISM